MKTNTCILLATLFFVGNATHCLAGWCNGKHKTERKIEKTVTQTNKISKVKARKVAYIDPETGKLTSTPPANSKLLQSKKTSDKAAELKVVKSPVKDGGYMVDLKGQFRQQIVVKKENGKLKKTCTNAGAHKK